jgi:NAD(P)-dependent dehydrogenase (short-subunit alcohol dehydrogenase family)
MDRTDETHKELDGKVAIVTGGASGIGRATAELLARAGAHTVVADIDERGAEVARAIVAGGGGAEYAPLDVTDERAWESLVQTVLGARGHLDVLVNNAGIAVGRQVTEMSYEEWRKVLAVNVDGTFFGTKHALRAMRHARTAGVIVNISSAAGIVGTPGASAYAASKGAVRLFTKAVALECAAEGIRVNSIHPGAVKTPIWEKGEKWSEFVAKAGGPDAAWGQIAKSTPLGRMAEPEEIAFLVLYLASDRARFVTGSELVIDGGYTAG